MPDVFGQETPQEALNRVRQGAANRQAAFADTPAGRSVGGQAGTSLGAIFGPSLNKFIETRRDRKKAVANGMTEEEAKQKIPFGYTSVRRAERAQGFSSDASVILDALNAVEGSNPTLNRAKVMQLVSGRLRDAGELKSGQDMQKASIDLQQSEIQRLTNLDKIHATTVAARAQAANTVQNTEFKANSESDTFAKIINGKLLNITEVAKGDIQIRDAMRKEGFIKIGPGGIGTQLSEAVLTKTKPVSTEDLGFQFGMLNSLEVMQRVAPEVGFGTPILALMASRGVDLFGSGKLIGAVAHQKAVRAGIQSIIKGIPSNYDASIFEAMIPSLFRFQDGEFYQAQIDVLVSQTRDLIVLNIAAHKGSREPMPADIIMTAKRLGIDTDAIQGIAPSDQFLAVRQMEERHRKGFAAINEVAPEGENAEPTDQEIIKSFMVPK